MSKLLYVVGSPRQDASRSGAVAEAFLDTLRRADPELDVSILDLWREPLPEFDGDKAEAKMTVITGGTPEGAIATAWNAVTQVIDRFTSADQYLFTVPMWNGGVPYRLKLYIDILTQPGFLFGFDATTGYSALLQGKQAAVIYTSGVYGPGVAPSFGLDFHSKYFDWWLRFIGLTDVETIRYQPTLVTPDPDRAFNEAVAAARVAAGRFARPPRAA
jgi:FMN-dependent NADH-azoreductase